VPPLLSVHLALLGLLGRVLRGGGAV
jgi:hypothetical protein